MNFEQLNDIIQWVGAVFIIAMHVLNAVGPRAYPWNIVAGGLGTVAFLTWSIRVDNTPQLIVNIVALVICATGIYTALQKRVDNW